MRTEQRDDARHSDPEDSMVPLTPWTPLAGERLLPSDTRHAQVADFLIREAALLDAGDFASWLCMLTEDVHYCMPSRATLYRRDDHGSSGYDFSTTVYDDDLEDLRMRVRRNVEIRSAWSRDPEPRVHRMVSNVVVSSRQTGNYEATSSVLLVQNQLDSVELLLVSARRRDQLRTVEGALRLSARTVFGDQTRLSGPFHNEFL